MKLMLARLKSLANYKNLLKQLVIRDLKVKYRRSFLGYLWSVLNPLFVMLVMVIVFSRLFRFDIPNYPVYLLSGQILFSFMTEATNNAMVSIVGSASLLKKTYVPKYIFAFAKVTSATVNLLFSMGALLVVMLLTGTKFTVYDLLFPLVFIQLYAFCLGMGLFLAQLNVFFRDIQYIYSVISTAWLYATPIFYPETVLDGKLGWVVKNLNPMYMYIAQFRSLILYGNIPETSTVIGGVLFSFVFLVFGTWMFSKNQDKFILYI